MNFYLKFYNKDINEIEGMIFMDEMDEQQKSKTVDGCGCLIALGGCLIPLICFLIPIALFFQSISKEVMDETIIFESSSPDENYTLSVIRRDISFHGKYVFYIEAGDGTRIEVDLVSHETFDASKVLIEWNEDHTATITLNGDYDQIISFTAPNIFELR